MEWKGHRVFQQVWRIGNLLLVASLLATAYSAGWEFSVRSYLRGFSDGIVPASVAPEQKVESILNWMQSGTGQTTANVPTGLARRNPQITLNSEQLLRVCGTATNAFLNLARISGLRVRRLLLLTPDRNTKHVVAEVFLEGSWIIVDPTYRVIMRDAQGRMLTRSDLRDPRLFAEATEKIPGYPPEYDYQKFAHVRLARLPLAGLRLRSLLDAIFPRWEEALDWDLLLERESFFILCISLASLIFFFSWRLGLGWYAEKRLGIRRVRLRQKAWRAGAALFAPPEIK